jgi:hypothetical protein
MVGVANNYRRLAVNVSDTVEELVGELQHDMNAKLLQDEFYSPTGFQQPSNSDERALFESTIGENPWPSFSPTTTLLSSPSIDVSSTEMSNDLQAWWPDWLFENLLESDLSSAKQDQPSVGHYSGPPMSPPCFSPGHSTAGNYANAPYSPPLLQTVMEPVLASAGSEPAPTIADIISYNPLTTPACLSPGNANGRSHRAAALQWCKNLAPVKNWIARAKKRTSKRRPEPPKNIVLQDVDVPYESPGSPRLDRRDTFESMSSSLTEMSGVRVPRRPSYRISRGAGAISELSSGSYELHDVTGRATGHNLDAIHELGDYMSALELEGEGHLPGIGVVHG